jgi:DNA (cytosine-5)-methyltransferase 1
VERNVVFRQEKGWLLLHLPLLAASALDDGEIILTDFLSRHSADYLPGFRRRRNHTTTKITQKRATTTIIHETQTSPSTFTFVELFAGIGGFRLGLESLGGACLFSSELSSHAASIYRDNFADASSTLCEGDMLDLDSQNDLPKQFDILTAGFPCQPFTNRGHQQGFIDDRGQLYRELARVLHEKQPPLFLFENVAGLVTMEGGSRTKREKNKRTIFKTGAVFHRILDVFQSCGYKVDWKIVNSRHFLPQQRERVYIVGTRNDLGCDSFNWENLVGDQNDNSNEHRSATMVRDILEPKESPSVVACELTLSQWSKVQTLHRKKNTLACKSGCIDVNSKAPTLISQYHRVSSFSTKFLFEQSDGTPCDGIGGNRRPRFLTPRECCRIMGFPESFKVPSFEIDGKDKIAQFYKGIGNAVTPQVISAIGKELVGCLIGIKKQTTKEC